MTENRFIEIIKPVKEELNKPKVDWERVYKHLSQFGNECGEVTQTFRGLGIYPELILTYLPDYYLMNTNIDNFEIGNNITDIGADVFCNCANLTSITIPESVTTIGSSVFRGCIELTNVTIPDRVTSIGRYAFSNCTSLVSIIIPDNVTTLQGHMFHNCTSLTSVTIPSSITSIGYEAFVNCGDQLVINYQGTKEQWKKIYNSETFQDTYFTVNCSDGKIVKRKKK